MQAELDYFLPASHITVAFRVQPLPSEHVSLDKTSHGLLYISLLPLTSHGIILQVTKLLDQI